MSGYEKPKSCVCKTGQPDFSMSTQLRGSILTLNACARANSGAAAGMRKDVQTFRDYPEEHEEKYLQKANATI